MGPQDDSPVHLPGTTGRGGVERAANCPRNSLATFRAKCPPPENAVNPEKGLAGAQKLRPVFGKSHKERVEWGSSVPARGRAAGSERLAHWSPAAPCPSPFKWGQGMKLQLRFPLSPQPPNGCTEPCLAPFQEGVSPSPLYHL